MLHLSDCHLSLVILRWWSLLLRQMLNSGVLSLHVNLVPFQQVVFPSRHQGPA